MLGEKAVVNAEDALQSIRSGMSNEDLMEKYRVSRRGLESLFRKLVAAGKIDDADLDLRRRSLRQQSWVYSVGHHLLHRKEEEPSPADAALPQEEPSIWQRYKHYFCALIGAFAGGALVFVGMILVDLWNAAGTKRQPGPLAPLIAAIDHDIAEADHLIKILQAIASDSTGKDHSRALTTASDYQRCLKNCANFRGPDDSDKVLLVNCRRECMAMYSERVKEIRKRYYGDLELE